MESWHGTTILGVRRGGRTVIAGDGQVSMGNTVMKPNAKTVRRLGAEGKVIGGFAGATADAFTLFERLESKLEQYPGQLTRAAVELAKDWRTDRYLRRLEARLDPGRFVRIHRSHIVNLDHVKKLLPWFGGSASTCEVRKSSMAPSRLPWSNA